MTSLYGVLHVYSYKYEYVQSIHGMYTHTYIRTIFLLCRVSDLHYCNYNHTSFGKTLPPTA